MSQKTIIIIAAVCWQKGYGLNGVVVESTYLPVEMVALVWSLGITRKWYFGSTHSLCYTPFVNLCPEGSVQ